MIPNDIKKEPGKNGFDTDLNTHKRFGLTVFVLLFGFGGLWATTAPIDGAAVAPGRVTSRSYSKVVQHLEGGIIKNIFVENGASVRLGDPILELDSTQSKAQLEITNSQLTSLRALEIRLSAERDNLSSLIYSSSFLADGSRAEEESQAQIEIFNARRSTLEGGIAVLEQRVGQLQTQITGYNGLKESKERLSKSFNEELQDVGELLSQGFSDKNRLREIERNVAVLEGEVHPHPVIPH